MELGAEELRRFANGELDAFEALFRAYQTRVYAWIAGVVRNPGVAEELTIETFWRIWAARARYDAERDFGAWAHRIAINLAYNHLRGAHRETVPYERAREPAALPVDDAVEQCVRRAVGELPERLREPTLLVLMEDYSHAEVGRALGLTVAAVKSRVFRAMKMLRERLAELGVRP